MASRGKGKTITVRVDAELERLVQEAAGSAGVTVSEYVREATLARALTDGQELVESSHDAAHEQVGHSPALRGQSDTVNKHARDLTTRAQTLVDRTRQLRDDISQATYVALLWRALQADGVAGIVDLVPKDVEWRPALGEGRVLRGTDELKRFWASRRVVVPAPRMFYEHGDDVLVESELALPDGTLKSLWTLYRFQRRRLTEAVGFHSRAEALAYP